MVTRRRTVRRKRGPKSWLGERGRWEVRLPNRLRPRMVKRQKELGAASLSDAAFTILEAALDAGDPELRTELAYRERDDVRKKFTLALARAQDDKAELRQHVRDQGHELRILRAFKAVAVGRIPTERLQALQLLSEDQLQAIYGRVDVADPLGGQLELAGQFREKGR